MATMPMTKLLETLPRPSRLTIAALALALAVAPALAQSAQPPRKPAGPWMNKTLSPDRRADLLVQALTLDEKISLLHANGWEMGGPETLPLRALGNAGFIAGIPRFGIPDLQMADATVGVTHSSVFGRYSTPLPSTIAEASSWDVDLAREYGSLIGRELREMCIRDRVVRAHHRARARPLEGNLEAEQIAFAHGPLAHLHIDERASAFLIVHGVVFEVADDVLLLERLHLGARHRAGQDRIFAVILEVAAVARLAHQVGRSAQRDLEAQLAAFLAHQGTELIGQCRVPGCGQGERTRQGRGVAAVSCLLYTSRCV